MEIEKIKAIIEAILFAAGRQVTIKELMISLEMPKEDLENIKKNNSWILENKNYSNFFFKK